MIRRILTLLLVACLLPMAAQAQVQDAQVIAVNLTINEFVVFAISSNVLDIIPGMPPTGNWISTDRLTCTVDASVDNGRVLNLYSETDGDFLDPVSLDTIVLGADFSIRGDGDFAAIPDPPLTVASQLLQVLGSTGTYAGDIFLRYWDLARTPGNYTLNWTLTAIIE